MSDEVHRQTKRARLQTSSHQDYDDVLEHATAARTHLLASDKFKLGDQVRLVNLPSFPSLEGLIATVIGADDDLQRIHVKLNASGAVKRVSPNPPFHTAHAFLGQNKQSRTPTNRCDCALARPSFRFVSQRSTLRMPRVPAVPVPLRSHDHKGRKEKGQT